MRVSNEGCSVWILPQLVAPEPDLNLARVVGRRSRKPSKTVNVPSKVTSRCLVSPDAWTRLLYRAGRKHGLSLVLLRKRPEQVPEILDLFDSRRFKNCPAVRKWCAVEACAPVHAHACAKDPEQFLGIVDHFAASPNRLFQCHKRRQLFRGTHNVTFSVAVRVKMSCPHGRIRCFKRNRTTTTRHRLAPHGTGLWLMQLGSTKRKIWKLYT
jgi:hypothetical protein